MLEIPGEEAATDPGLEQRQRQAAEQQAAKQRSTSRARGLGAAAVVLLALAGAGGWYQWQAQQEELVYELEDVYMAPRDGMIAHKEVAPSAPAPTTGIGKRPGKRSPGSVVPAGGGEGIATAGSSGTGGPSAVKLSAPTGAGGVAAVGIDNVGPGGSRLGDVEIAVSRVNTTVLQTDEEIKAMAKEVSSAYYPQVESCVQRRLKADPTFQGGWKVKFTIETDGTVSGFGSTALENADPELESCMQRTITAWRFQRIARPFKVGKTYRFAAGW